MAITVHKENYRYGIKYGSCLSTDVKPTVGYGAGSTLYESDTGILYLYTGSEWVRKYDSVLIPAGALNIGDVDIATLPTANFYPVKIHTIAITVVNGAAAQTDSITIDGVVCTFTSDATPTTTEISTGLRAAIAASAAAGKFVVTGTTNVVLTPAYAYDPIVEVSANLADTQTIGAVSLLGVKLSSGESHIGQVGSSDFPIVVTPVIGAAAFSANDVVGGKLTLANAMRVGAGTGKLNSLFLVDTSKQNAALTIFIFKTDLAGTYNDNAAEAVTAADWLKCIGQIDVIAADYKQWVNASLVHFGGMDMDVFATSGTTLYALIVTTGTPTYGANALQLTFGLGRN